MILQKVSQDLYKVSLFYSFGILVRPETYGTPLVEHTVNTVVPSITSYNSIDDVWGAIMHFDFGTFSIVPQDTNIINNILKTGFASTLYRENHAIKKNTFWEHFHFERTYHSNFSCWQLIA